MRIKISAGVHVLYLAELVTFFRCEGLRGHAQPAPSIDALTVEIELGDRDLVLDAHGLDPDSQGRTRGKRRLEISTPTRLPTDDLEL